MSGRHVAESLFKIGAVTINTVAPYKYASGILSPLYVDCRILNSFPQQRTEIIRELLDIIDNKIGRNNITVIVGSGHSGISLAAYLSNRLKLPIAYTRESKKEHG